MTDQTIEIDLSLLKYFRSRLRKWGKESFSNYPWRKTENKFHGLIAEIMLQRTNADQVVPVYEAFTKKYAMPEDLSKMGEKAICDIFNPLGLHWRGHQFFELIRELNKAGGVVPEQYDSLVSLPGIGPYAASAFLSFHCNQNATIIDSNVVRLYGRFFGFHTHPETRREKSFVSFSVNVTPRCKNSEFNYSLLDFTRAICKPKPDCINCPLVRKCYHANN
jgi:A/G-specific adenine glycosylase